MKLIAFSDFRTQDIDQFIDFLENSKFIPDLILYAGDDVCRFGNFTVSGLKTVYEQMDWTTKIQTPNACLFPFEVDENIVLIYFQISRSEIKTIGEESIKLKLSKMLQELLDDEYKIKNTIAELNPFFESLGPDWTNGKISKEEIIKSVKQKLETYGLHTAYQEDYPDNVLFLGLRYQCPMALVEKKSCQPHLSINLYEGISTPVENRIASNSSNFGDKISKIIKKVEVIMRKENIDSLDNRVNLVKQKLAENKIPIVRINESTRKWGIIDVYLTDEQYISISKYLSVNDNNIGKTLQTLCNLGLENISGSCVENFLDTTAILHYEEYKDKICGVLSIASTKENLFEKIATYSRCGVCVVIGNDDTPASKMMLKGNRVFDVHERPVIVEDYAIIGQEGATGRAGPVVYEEKTVKDHLNSLKRLVETNNPKSNYILLSHVPPHGILDKALSAGNEHIGSNAVLEFLKENDIPLVVCGHVHSEGGKNDTLNNTVILNASSHDSKGSVGKAALIDMDSKGSFHLDEWIDITHLQSISGIGYAYERKLKQIGIKGLRDLIDKDPNELADSSGIGKSYIEKWIRQAKSILSKNIQLIAKLDVRLRNAAFVDIETRGFFDCTISMISILSADETRPVTFIDLDGNSERKIIEEFSRFIKSKGYDNIYCYGDYDRQTLDIRMKHTNIDASELSKFKNIYPEIKKAVVLPVTSYGLKEVARCFGFKWRHPYIHGHTFPYVYQTYLQTKDEDLLHKLVEYNQDDVIAIKFVFDKIEELHSSKYLR